MLRWMLGPVLSMAGLFGGIVWSSSPVIGEEHPLAEPVEPAETVTLFNGEDLAGWAGDVALWEAGDGVLSCKDGPRGVLRTEQSYSGYILTLEWRWPERGGDSGVFVHVGPGQGTGIWPQCIETQLYSGNAGDFWLLGVGLVPAEGDGDAPQTGGVIRRTGEVREAPIGEWNTMTILCDGGYIEVTINGELANAGFDATRTHGPIALQCEGQAIEFRGITIGPLQ